MLRAGRAHNRRPRPEWADLVPMHENSYALRVISRAFTAPTVRLRLHGSACQPDKGARRWLALAHGFDAAA
jgi:hypothetical protein